MSDFTDAVRWGWLASSRELQERYFGRDYNALRTDPILLADTIMMNHTAAVVELGEAMNEVGWKPWATPRGWVNREAFIGELIDVMHFIANLLTAVDCTDEEYEAYYQDKQAVNRARMTSGNYDGIKGKCPHCHRAWDDPGVLCRPGLHVASDVSLERP